MNRKPEKKEPKPVPQSANYLDPKLYEELVGAAGNDSNLLIVFYVQIMPDDFVMQLHRF